MTNAVGKGNLCVDASVWIRLLTHEDRSETTAQMFESWLNQFSYFLQPSILLFEIASAIRKKQKLGILETGYKVRDLLHELYKLPVLLYQSEKLLRRSVRLAETLETTDAYDASYLALAIWKKVPLFTADEKFFRRAKTVYSDCHLV